MNTAEREAVKERFRELYGKPRMRQRDRWLFGFMVAVCTLPISAWAFVAGVADRANDGAVWDDRWVDFEVWPDHDPHPLVLRMDKFGRVEFLAMDPAVPIDRRTWRPMLLGDR